MDINNKSNIILFYSPQGGTGKSTLAVNTAIYSTFSGKKTLLVDMSVYGSITSMLRVPQKGGLGLSPLITMYQLDSNSEDTTEFTDIIKDCLVCTEIKEKKLDVLLSANPVNMESLKENEAKMIIDNIADLNYDLIIIDTSSELSEKNMMLLETADRVIVPTIQDISCGWKMLMFKEVMDKFLSETNKIGLVINKCSNYSGFNNQEFEEEIGYKVIAEIPFFLKEFQTYINKGELIYNMRSKKVRKAFQNAFSSILSEGWVQNERRENDQIKTT